MNIRGKSILVTGATGQQGGATVDALLADGWTVRALLRDPSSRGARDLAARNVEIARGDFRDPQSLASAVAGCHGVFSVQPSSGQPEYGVSDDDEAAFGVSLADAAVKGGVRHIVYSSLAGAAPDTGVGHFNSKFRIEEHVRSLPIDWTIIRPVAFMEILLLPHFGLSTGTLTFFMQPDGPMQFIAKADIGRIAANAFADPSMVGKTFDIAGDELTGREVAAKIGQSIGQPVAYRQFPADVRDQLPLMDKLVRLVEAGKANGKADIPQLRKLVPGLLTFDDWLELSGRRAIEKLKQAA